MKSNFRYTYMLVFLLVPFLNACEPEMAEDPPTVEEYTAHVRYYHASERLPNLDVMQKEKNITTNLKFQQVSEYHTFVIYDKEMSIRDNEKDSLIQKFEHGLKGGGFFSLFHYYNSKNELSSMILRDRTEADTKKANLRIINNVADLDCDSVITDRFKYGKDTTTMSLFQTSYGPYDSAKIQIIYHLRPPQKDIIFDSILVDKNRNYLFMTVGTYDPADKENISAMIYDELEKPNPIGKKVPYSIEK